MSGAWGQKTQQQQQQPEVSAEDFEALAREFSDATLEAVQLDGVAVLRLIKHCTDVLPDTATGQLVGLDNGPVLEVSNSFPLPQAEEEEHHQDGGHFVDTMLRCFREVNMDSTTVGWYTTAYADNVFMDADTIALQHEWQTQRSPKAVMLVFDPLKTTQDGTVSLRAFRLTQAFLGAYRAQAFTVESLRDAGVSHRDIFEEVPIRVRNAPAIGAFFQSVAPQLEPARSRLDLAVYPYLEKNMEYLIDALDDLSAEQARFQNYQRMLARYNAAVRRRAEEAAAAAAAGEEESAAREPPKVPQQPRQLETLLLSSQIGSFCDQINRVAGQSAAKIFLLGGLQQDPATVSASASATTAAAASAAVDATTASH